MSKLRELVRGASWTYGSQVGTAVVQFAYAAITSRLVSSGGFGSYAVALTASGLVILLANGGLAQSVSRMQETARDVISGLATYSLLLGCVAGVALFLLSEPWSILWSDSSSVSLVRWLAISALVAPNFSLAAGLMRRRGQFKSLAIATLFSNCTGMLVGVCFVLKYETATSLVASAVTAQVVLVVCAVALTGGESIRLGSMRTAYGEIRFSANLTVSSMLSYLANNIGKWSVSRWVGASALGQWNRAEVVTTVPFFQVQTALAQVVYPEFRHDRQRKDRARTVWPDMMGLALWLCVPAACAVVPLLPFVVPFLFGPGWEMAADLSQPLIVIGAVQVATTLLGSGVEALGRFTWIWTSQILMICIQLIGVGFTISFRNPVPAIVALAAIVLFRQIFYVSLLQRAGYFRASILVRHYLEVVVASAFSMFVVWLFILSVSRPEALLAALPLTLAATLLLCVFRRLLPPVRIIGKYMSGGVAMAGGKHRAVSRKGQESEV